MKSKPWTFFRIIQLVLHQNFVIITSCLMNKKCFSLHVRVTTYLWIQNLPQWLKNICANWYWNGSLAALNKKTSGIGRTNYKCSLKNKHVLFESSHVTLQAIYFGVGLGVHSTSTSSEGTLQRANWKTNLRLWAWQHLAQLKIQLSVLLIFQRDTLKTCIHSDSSNRNEPSSLPPLTKSTQQSWQWSCNLEYSLWKLRHTKHKVNLEEGR